MHRGFKLKRIGRERCELHFQTCQTRLSNDIVPSTFSRTRLFRAFLPHTGTSTLRISPSPFTMAHTESTIRECRAFGSFTPPNKRVAGVPESVLINPSNWPNLIGWAFLLNRQDRKSTRLNSSHQIISYAVFCLKKKKD